MSLQYTVNQPVSYPVTAPNFNAGVIPNLYFIKDGVKVTPAYTATVLDAPTNLYLVTFTPTTLGKWHIACNGPIVLSIDVVSKLSTDILANLEDEALGSWAWDKTLSKLTLHRQNGTVLSQFNIVDTNIVSSREVI
jgi:hypothetical protein